MSHFAPIASSTLKSGVGLVDLVKDPYAAGSLARSTTQELRGEDALGCEIIPPGRFNAIGTLKILHDQAIVPRLIPIALAPSLRISPSNQAIS